MKKQEQYSNIKNYYNSYSEWYNQERTGDYYSFVNDLEIDLISKYARGKKVLEIGCGTGIILEASSKMASDAQGIDLSEGMVEVSKKKGLQAQKANVVQLPFPDKSFDLVYSFKVLPHVPEIKKAISEIKRVLKDDGVAVLEFFNPFSIKYFTNKIFNIVHRRKVYIRYDHLAKIESYLPAGAKVVQARGIRIFSPFNACLTWPVFSSIYRFLDRKFCDSFLARFGGYLAVVIKF